MAKKIPVLAKGDMVVVSWVDATGDSCWVNQGEEEWPEMRCETVGYFWKKSQTAVMLMNSLFTDWQKGGTIGGQTCIPIGMITKIRKLE